MIEAPIKSPYLHEFYISSLESQEIELNPKHTWGMPRKLTSLAAMRMTVARKPYSFQGSGSPGSGSQGWARRWGSIQ